VNDKDGVEALMTIAIGLCGNGGLVLASDSQETISGYVKNEVGKSETIIFANRNVFCFVGAGDADYIKTATVKAIVGLDVANTFDEVQKTLEDNLLGFFDKHLAQWAFYPEHDRPSVELLIGVSMRSGPFALYHYCGTSFHRVSEKAIGAGVLLADGLLHQFNPVGATVEQASSIAVYIISKVKQQVDSCGGFTDLVAFRKNGDWALTDSRQLEVLEKRMKKDEEGSITALKKRIQSKAVDLSWHSEHLEKKAKKPTS
jgi:20S proteasome alpha/beta subunit